MNSNELAEHEKRSATIARDLFWVEARNRDSGATETVGFWNGEDVQAFDIGGSRTYFPAMVRRDAVRGGVGLSVNFLTVYLGGVTPEVQTLIRTYEPRFAKVEIHVATFAASNLALLGVNRVFKGFVDEVRMPTASMGGENVAAIKLASAARVLTRPLPLTRSDAAQRRRSSTDRGREYVSVAGREVLIGEARG